MHLCKQQLARPIQCDRILTFKYLGLQVSAAQFKKVMPSKNHLIQALFQIK